MHFHHRHDIDGCCDDHPDQPVLATLLATLDRMELVIMSAVQDSINAATVALGDLIAEVQNLKSQVSPAADTSALDAAVAAAQAVLPAPTPVDPTADAGQSQSDPAPVDPGPADVPAPDQSIPSVPLA